MVFIEKDTYRNAMELKYFEFFRKSFHPLVPGVY